MNTWDVIVVGEIYLDHILSGFEAWPGPGEEVLAKAYDREIGGGAANTACGLSRLGRSVRLVGVVGAAEAPWLTDRLSAFGVGADGLVRADGPTGVTISVSTAKDRSFFTHLGVNDQLEAVLGSPSFVSDLARARHVHFAMPLGRSLAEQLLPALKAAGCTTSLDVGYQPQWLGDPANHAVLRAVDYFLPNEKEAALLAGGGATEAFLAFCGQAGLPSSQLKLGQNGAVAKAGGLQFEVAPPRVEAVDTTGAGDAFDAGFIDALIAGAGPQERLGRACVCGALSTRAPGALAALPDWDELWSVYDQTYRS